MNIVITGASRGIGKAIAAKFAAAVPGAMLLLNARNKETLEQAAVELNNAYPACKVHFFPADLSIKEEAESFGDWCLGYGTPDVLVNNAGSFLPGSIHNEPEGTLQKMIEINLYSAYYVTRAILPKMISQKRGHIFNISSIAGLKAYDNGGAYSISKFALSGFSKNLREEMKPYNIKVTAVYPGATYTDSWASSGVSKERIMEADDIAEMIFAAAQLSPRACVEEIILRPQAGDL